MDPIKDQGLGCARGARSCGWREAGVYAAVAVLVAGSAIATKEFGSSGRAPALAVIEHASTGALLSHDEVTLVPVSLMSTEPMAGVTGFSDNAIPIDQSVIESNDAQMSDADPDTRWFNGRQVRPLRTVTMRVTAYSPDKKSCGPFADGKTATLHSVDTNCGALVAADPTLFAYGTMLTVPGYDNDQIVPVLDCGGAIRGNRLDVLFPTHNVAREWGVREVDVVVWEYADGLPAPNVREIR